MPWIDHFYHNYAHPELIFKCFVRLNYVGDECILWPMIWVIVDWLKFDSIIDNPLIRSISLKKYWQSNALKRDWDRNT